MPKIPLPMIAVNVSIPEPIYDWFREQATKVGIGPDKLIWYYCMTAPERKPLSVPSPLDRRKFLYDYYCALKGIK